MSKKPRKLPKKKQFKIINKKSTGKRYNQFTPKWYDEEKKLVGDYINCGKFGIVELDGIPLAPNIFIPLQDSMNAKENDKVVVEITSFPRGSKNRKKPEGKIVKIIGCKTDKGVDIEGILNEYNNSYEFTKAQLSDAKALNQELNLEEELKSRTDFTDIYTFTIDGVDSKDLDDAISIEYSDDTYILYVHIADVSSYIVPGSRLDTESYIRGTSIYLDDRVVPMLPADISNGICSLNEGVNRRVLTCKMWINKKGDVEKYKILKGIIKSDRRLDYYYVNKLVYDKDEKLRENDKQLVEKLDILKNLVDILKAKRVKNGMLEFETDEAKIILDDDNKPIDIELDKRVEAYQMIEHLMLTANETVARHAIDNNLPFIYRVHELPSEEKIKDLVNILDYYKIDYNFDDEIKPSMIQDVLNKIKERDNYKALMTMILRSQMQAKYDTCCIGHFGIASLYYCHFTSPIRRYPDLAIHRILSEEIEGKLDDVKISRYSNSLPLKALYLSDRERKAISTQRTAFKLKSVEYMCNHIGERFDVVVSGVTANGLFVSTDNLCEGFVFLSSMGKEHYEYNEKYNYLIGERTGKIYTIGDMLKVRLVKADKKKRYLDFEMVEDNETNS